VILDCFKLDGKVALVTGASSEIGEAIALALAEAGADVACQGNTRSPQAVCARIAELGRFHNHIVNSTAEHFGRIDILVNNASAIRRTAAIDYSDVDWDLVVEINLSTPFHLSQLAGRHMMAQGGGKIINIASLLAFQGGITAPAFAASKGGLVQLTKALANEWANAGVNVNAIAPGYMRTASTQALQDDPVRSRQIIERIPAGRWGEAPDLAGAAVFLASRASDYMHGHVLVVDGGWMGR
jgi:2-deoxy-D-gluconate 3-dehydrogenase